MHAEIEDVLQQQRNTLEAMGAITRMRRGTLSKQEYAHRRSRKGGQGIAGPYFVWQGSINGKHFSKRVGAEQAVQLDAEIEQRREFERLVAQYVALAERAADLTADEVQQTQEVKKKPSRRLSKARK